jgi:hypothetical protein
VGTGLVALSAIYVYMERERETERIEERDYIRGIAEMLTELATAFLPHS